MKPSQDNPLFLVVSHPLFEFAVPILVLGLESVDGDVSLDGFFLLLMCWLMGFVHGMGVAMHRVLGSKK